MRSPDEMRRKFRPTEVRVLFVGESPPAGGTFFYFGNSILFRATRDAFQRAVPDLLSRDFLASFSGLGCYLEDLCSQPVNRLPDAPRRTARRDSESALAARLTKTSPKAVIVVMSAIAENVRRSLASAEIDCPVYVLPFPSRPEHKRRYVEELAEIVGDLRTENALIAVPRPPSLGSRLFRRR
jgi:hypothetical protein